MTRTAAILRSVAAPLIGYAVIVAGTTVSFKLAGGINLRSPLPNFVLGTLGIAVSGLLGGMTAGWVGGRKPVWHATSVLIFLVMDSVTVLFIRHRHRLDPLWFGVLSALGLMLATIVGGILIRSLHRPPRPGCSRPGCSP
ncbi:MAG TPA: hypothetical protein VHE33_06065 [Acidobacteriaceae bacterium]|jgi:hypothetical protein|nr:hypothetical protein [Acidobacteriaceae bacterium]